MHIEPVITKKQAEDVSFLAQSIWTEHYTPIIGAVQVAYMLAHFQSSEAIWGAVREGHTYWIIKDNLVSVGYVGFNLQEDTLFLSKIYLKKEMRGKKFARKIIQELISLARKNALPTITLTVNKQNLDTILAYEKLQFKKVREQVADIGHGYVMDDFIMELVVPA